MKYKNFVLLNEALEKIWDLESFVNLVDHLSNEPIKLNESTMNEVRQQLKELSALCVKLA